jgi:7-cyano-7-deazaguanine tRNA-ribosyltransferase
MNDLQKELLKMRSIADYQLGKDSGKALLPDEVKVVTSRNTGRIRYIYLDNELLATLRPTDGTFALALAGAKRLINGVKSIQLRVKVQKHVEHFTENGKSVFAKHVVYADEDIRPKEEVIIIDENNRVLAVGKAVLTGREMREFNHGVAVKVRRGASEEVKNT